MNCPLLTVAIASAACFALWPADVEDPGPFAINPVPILTWTHRWGVKADGVTDDAPAINEAIIYAHTNKYGRRIVQLPSGDLIASNTITIYSYDGLHGVTLCGKGREDTKILGAHTNVVVAIHGNGNGIKNMTIKWRNDQ